MDELKLIFASNLIKLRTGAGLTQAVLGGKLNYSDKTVSKWERAESMPDAAALKKLSEIFNVSVDSLLSAEVRPITPGADKYQESGLSRAAIIRVAFAGIWTLGLLVFVIFWIAGSFKWLVFAYCIPLSLIAVIVFNALWQNGKNSVYIACSLVVSVFIVIYLTFLEYNPWQIFLVAIPALLIVINGFRIRKKNK